jgi:hypothetical protein
VPEESPTGRRYCSVCGYLSSEPSPTCPQCTLATAHTVPLGPAPPVYAREPQPVRRSEGPPAWAIIGAILVIILVVILVTLAADGVFSSSGSVLVDGPLSALFPGRSPLG